ncbi:caspase family protein [Nocardia tengchongensis]|uniref:caspase family protein n=1 Tax=Nocardia tengchongensis TaxID=2055889 RepID=UPI0036A22F8C
MRLPDPERSRAVLIATAEYTAESGFEQLPAVANNLNEMTALLRDVTGLRYVDARLNPRGAAEFSVALESAAREAEDMLLLYYSGHGVLARNALTLTHSNSLADHPGYTAVEYDLIRHDLLGSRARVKVVILDCCHSGAIDAGLMASPEHVIGDLTGIAGTYVLTATNQRSRFAIAGGPAGCTAFTGTLVDILRNGIASEGEFISMALLYPMLRSQLISRGFPSPQASGAGTAADIALARNVRWDGYQPPSASGRQPASASLPAATVSRWVIPTLSDDGVLGTDRLGIEPDARALAALVASKQLEPPLAIGIYGKWGSGKTFFMRRIESGVEEFTQGQVRQPEYFVERVAHVWFNAWHYARGDIWASLLEHIFCSLSPRESVVDTALDAVIARVDGVQQVVAEAQQRVDAAQERSNAVALAIDEARVRHRNALDAISTVSGKDLWTAVRADPELQRGLDEAMAELKIDRAVQTAREMSDAADSVVQLGSRFQVLATAGKNAWTSPLALSVAVLLAGGAGAWILAHFADQIGAVSAVVAEVTTVAGAAATWIGRQSTLARRILAPAERIRTNLGNQISDLRTRQDAELDGLRGEAAAAEAELAAATRQRTAAEADLELARKDHADLTGTRLLRRYLAERAGSGDYDKYMGVIALAHRDLQDLSDHLRYAAHHNSGDTDQLSRIVLYIDDLDRCDSDTVADVLDTVHLLLALPLFVVVVGVDPQWLAQSLRRRHTELLESSCKTSAADYLEKILQLTYTLPPMDATKCATLLASAAHRSRPTNATEPLLPQTDSVDARSPVSADPDTIHIATAARNDGAHATEATTVDDASSRNDLQRTIEALTLTESDIKALGKVAPLVASSPRRAKRFLNIYLVIRARALSDAQHLPSPIGVLNDASSSTLLVFLAMLIGIPRTLGPTLRGPTPPPPVTLAEWSKFVENTDEAEHARLVAFIADAGPTGELAMSDLLAWIAVARPYSSLATDSE